MSTESLYNLQYFEENSSSYKLARFLRLSSMIHALVVAVLFILSQTVQQPIIPKLITIEILDHALTPKKGLIKETPIKAKDLVLKEEKSPRVDLKNPGLAPSPKIKNKMITQRVSKTKNIVNRSVPTPTPTLKRQAISQLKPSSQISRPAHPSTVIKAPVVVQPLSASLDDIQSPDVESFGKALEASTEMNAEELGQDFEKVDHKSNQEARKARKLLTTEAQDADQIVETSVEKLKNKNQKLQSRAHQSSKKFGSLYGQMQQQTDNQLNDEVQGLEGYAQGLGNHIQVEDDIIGNGGPDGDLGGSGNSQSGNLASGSGSGSGTQKGQGNYAGTPAHGQINGDIRSLGDLRQKPGNVKPNYTIEDRLRRRQGKVIYVAYVNKDGSLASFKMVQSSGYVSLDEKTYNALKRWKFYPGQEGWVELPFKWDLKGGVKELPALLRADRSVSVN